MINILFNLKDLVISNLTKVKLINFIMRNLSQSNILRKEKKIHARSQHLALPKGRNRTIKELNLYKNRQNSEILNQPILQKIRQ